MERLVWRCRFAALGVALASCLAIVTPARATGGGSLLDDILQRGELRVGVSPGFVPFVAEGGGAEATQREMKEKLTPDPSGVLGFDVELARALATSLGVRLAVVKASGIGALQDMVREGKVDCALAGLTRTLERARRFYLSSPYFVSGLVVLVPEDSPHKSLDDVNRPGVRVLVKPRATSEAFARASLPKATLVPIDDEKTFGKTLREGGCVGVLDAVKARSFKLSGLLTGAFRRLEGRRFTDEYYGILMPRDEGLARYVDLFLEDFKRSGRFHELASRFNPWFRSED